MSAMSPLSLLVHPEAAGWHRAVLQPSAWPVSPPLLPGWREAGRRLQQALFPDPDRVIAGLQMWRLHVGGGAELLSRKAREWMPQFGVGVWLDQPPPSLWTTDEFLKHPPGTPMRPPIYQFIRIRPEGGWSEAWLELGGSGCWLAFSVQCDPESFLATEASCYRSWITEPTILAYDFYVPLLSLRWAEDARFAGRGRHLAGVLRYVRESDEDRGLLIYSDAPVERLLSAAGRLVPAGEAGDTRVWTFIAAP